MDKETQVLIQASMEKAKEKLASARDLLEHEHYDDAYRGLIMLFSMQHRLFY